MSYYTSILNFRSISIAPLNKTHCNRPAVIRNQSQGTDRDPAHRYYIPDSCVSSVALEYTHHTLYPHKQGKRVQ
jgi:hypothetical protein